MVIFLQTIVASTSLTLTDDTDLDIFEVGDSVHPLGANSLVFSANPDGTNAGITNPAEYNYRGNAFDGNTTTAGLFALATLVDPVTFVDKVEMLPAGNITSAGINVGLAGETIVTNPGSWDNTWSTVASGGGTIYNFSAFPPGDASSIFAWRVDGEILVIS